MAQVLTHIANEVGTLTLNRPEKRNAIGRQLLRDLQTGLAQLRAEPTVRVVVVRGAGGKAFSAGGDLKEFGTLLPAEVAEWVMLGNTVFNELATLPKPTVAVLDGYVLGGGLELALCCDFRLATTDALLGSPELRHGWLPGWGGLTRLRRLIGEAPAKELILLGETLPAEQARQRGLVTAVCSPDALEIELTRLTDTLRQLPPDIAAMAKLALQDETRTTTGPDLWFDVLAVHHAKQRT
jgi:enoyl-CoA hydratase/carnithine racemase